MSFWSSVALRWTGVEWYHIASGTELATATAWNVAGDVLAQGSVELSSTGLHNILFTVPYDIVPGIRYWLGVSLPGGATTRFSDPSAISVPSVSIYITGSLTVQGYNLTNGSANTRPTTTSGTRFGTGPILERIP
jgi:hypothetical protein